MATKRLVVFVSDHCPGCPEAVEIARDVQTRYLSVVVETFNVDHRQPGPEVFAVPTYMLDDRIAFLGNPSLEELGRLLEDPPAR